MIEVRLIDVTRLEDLLPFPIVDYELGEWGNWREAEIMIALYGLPVTKNGLAFCR